MLGKVYCADPGVHTFVSTLCAPSRPLLLTLGHTPTGQTEGEVTTPCVIATSSCIMFKYIIIR